ncbi:MAG: histidine phosphatase family protein, partial [Polyangiaceae bacterium]
AGRLSVDAFYRGPQRRHDETAAHLLAAAAEGGLELAEPEVVEEMAEIDMGTLLAEARQRVLPSAPDLAEQLAKGALDDRAKEEMRHMMGIFAKMLERWATGERFDGVEPFEDFAARVRRGLTAITRQQGRGKTVAVVTSGGPICASCHTALGIPAARAVELMIMAVNGSVTELVYTESKLSLRRFNDHGFIPPHLVTRI